MVRAGSERVKFAHEVALDAHEPFFVDGEAVFDLILDPAIEAYRARPAGPPMFAHALILHRRLIGVGFAL